MKLRRLQRQVCRQISGSPWLSLPSLSSISTSHIKLSFQSSKSGSKSGHNGVQFSSLICPAGSAPAALGSLLFDPPEPQIIGKTRCFATFLPFRGPGSSFFWDFLSGLIFFLLLFSSLLWLFPPLLFICHHLSILSEVWLLNFLRQVIFSIFLHLASAHFANPAWKLAVVRWRYGQRSLQRTSKQQINAPLHLLP